MKHMTPWAAEIDSQSYNNDVLYIQAAGNVYSDVIGAYWQAGYPYPLYLERELCRISDPAQSLQALTVGSVSDSDFETEDIVALGKSGSVSSFSRSGPGIWDVLKPEVVEYGGTHAYNKGSNPPILSTPPEVCPELIRKSPQGPAFARDAIGTSFAAPKVTYIATQIEKSLPEAPALLYRALIAQSARWPQKANDLTKEDCVSMLRHIGYGIPDVHRATSNDEYAPSEDEQKTNKRHNDTANLPVKPKEQIDRNSAAGEVANLVRNAAKRTNETRDSAQRLAIKFVDAVENRHSQNNLGSICRTHVNTAHE